MYTNCCSAGVKRKVKKTKHEYVVSSEYLRLRTSRLSLGSRHPAISVFHCGKLLTVGRVAQLAEQCPFKAWVDGSSPSALTRFVKRLLGNLFLTKQLGSSS